MKMQFLRLSVEKNIPYIPEIIITEGGEGEVEVFSAEIGTLVVFRRPCTV